VYEQLSGLLGLEGFTMTSVVERGDELDPRLSSSRQAVAAWDCGWGLRGEGAAAGAAAAPRSPAHPTRRHRLTRSYL
jgi:hypothetical protein